MLASAPKPSFGGWAMEHPFGVYHKAHTKKTMKFVQVAANTAVTDSNLSLGVR